MEPGVRPEIDVRRQRMEICGAEGGFFRIFACRRESGVLLELPQSFGVREALHSPRQRGLALLKPERSSRTDDLRAQEERWNEPVFGENAREAIVRLVTCLLYTSDAADDLLC